MISLVLSLWGEESAGRKESTWKERVEACGRNYTWGGTSSKFKKILGGKVRDKLFEKYGELKECRELKEAREEKQVRGFEARHKQKKSLAGK